jgi:hypothetical protein
MVSPLPDGALEAAAKVVIKAPANEGQTPASARMPVDYRRRRARATAHLIDAKVGDRVVTPRIGKPALVQALWSAAVCRIKFWSSRTPAAWSIRSSARCSCGSVCCAASGTRRRSIQRWDSRA